MCVLLYLSFINIIIFKVIDTMPDFLKAVT